MSPSQEQIADLVGVPVGTYVNWEIGRALPPKLSRDRLEDVFRALESGGELTLGLDVTPKVLKTLQEKAKSEGKSVEQVASDILQAIFGILTFLAIWPNL